MIKFNKSILVISLLTLISMSSVFAEGRKVAVFNPETHGISDDEQNWLPASIRRKLESNINSYTDLVIIDVQNEAAIKNLQKQSEGLRYDQESKIELGKMVSAEYAVFSNLTKVNGKYILSAQITNLSTGVSMSSVTCDSVSDCSLLFEGSSNSVNVITVKFCHDLGYPLSAIDEYTLLQGKNLSSDEQVTMAQKEVQAYNEKKAELEKKLNDIAASTERDKEAKKAKLDAQKQLLEQQQEIAREKYERLKKNQEQLIKDKQDQIARTAEQKKRIDEETASVEKQAALLRSKTLEGYGLDGQIAIIEAKKQVLVEIRSNVKKQEDMIIEQATAEYRKEAKKIDELPLRNAEKDGNGNMLPEVKMQRQAMKKQIKTEIEDRATKDVELLYSRIEEQESSILKTIDTDLQLLRKVRTVSSLQDSRILSVANYAGDKYTWLADAKLYILDYCIFNQSADISYSKLSGKEPVKANGKNLSEYNDYLDTVDMYDYMFRRQIPVVSLEIDYRVEALGDDRPSCYRVSILEFRYVDTKTGKVIQKIVPVSSSYIFKLKPATDLRNNIIGPGPDDEIMNSDFDGNLQGEKASNTRILTPRKTESKVADDKSKGKKKILTINVMVLD